MLMAIWKGLQNHGFTNDGLEWRMSAGWRWASPELRGVRALDKQQVCSTGFEGGRLRCGVLDLDPIATLAPR